MHKFNLQNHPKLIPDIAVISPALDDSYSSWIRKRIISAKIHRIKSSRSEFLGNYWPWSDSGTMLCNIQIYFYSFWSENSSLGWWISRPSVIQAMFLQDENIAERFFYAFFSQNWGRSGISWIRATTNISALDDLSCLIYEGISWCAWNYIWVIQAARKRMFSYFPQNNFTVQVLFNHQNSFSEIWKYIKYFSFNFKSALIACVTLSILVGWTNIYFETMSSPTSPFVFDDYLVK